jgi:para-nitrobenzyl esterase
VLTDSPLAIIRSGNFNRVPMLAGSNANEVQALAIADPHYLSLQAMPWGEYYQALYASFDKAEAQALAALYGSANFETPFDAWFTLKSDSILSCPSLIAPQAVAAQGIPAYHYLFSWQELGAVARLTGSFHGLDLFFVFGNFGILNTVISFDDIAAAIELSANMRKFWTAFARTHVPAAPGQPVWPEVASGTMILDTERSVDADVKRAACKFWDGRMPMGLENQTADFNNLILPHAH